MCGITGVFHLSGSERDPAATALAMADTLAHRGPDGRGAWGDAAAGIGLGHRRLAIIDLTETGAQPMHSADGRYVITYNGEVYNFRELRRELEARGRVFRGTSDTEVMLAAFGEWGVAQAVTRFAGMFAFAVFDRQSRTLHLVRDRIGVKPLYWTINGGAVLFGSELRALMAHPSFRKEVDREAVAAFLRYSYVPTPATIFRGVHKLPPGCILTVAAGGEPSIAPYWRLSEVVAQPGRDMSANEAAESLNELLLQAVRQRLIADVPLGAFLSGGLDSSTVVALMQACSNRPVRTFTIGFREQAYDESSYAREVGGKLGTEHTELMLDEKSALPLVGNIADWFDEPFADSSQLPTYLVSQMTRQHVTVALSGDGGDELFGGYPKYEMLAATWRRVGMLPRGLRAAFGGALRLMPERALAAGAGMIGLDRGRAQRIGEKRRRLAAALGAADSDEAAAAIDIVGTDQTELVPGAAGSLRPQRLAAHLPDLVSRMQAQDMATYLPDDILTKVDRCSMAVSLESREPLLDHRVVEFVWSLPAPLRRGREPKALLKSVFARYLPPAMAERPKRGFSVPLGQWLCGPLRGWAEDLLAPDKLATDGLLDIGGVRTLWQRHLTNREQNATALWNILMLRAWSERWLNP